MNRGYDSGQVPREDILLRIQALRDEIAALQRFMNKLEKEAAASKEIEIFL